MMSKEEALALMQETLDSLTRSGTLKGEVKADPDTILMGTGADASLDSLGFVTFIMELEDRLSDAADGDLAIVLTDIDGFDINSPILTAGVLADHLSKLTG